MLWTSADVQHCCIIDAVAFPCSGVTHQSAVMSTLGMKVGTEFGLQRPG
jgi:hypothetical protein